MPDWAINKTQAYVWQMKGSLLWQSSSSNMNDSFFSSQMIFPQWWLYLSVGKRFSEREWDFNVPFKTHLQGIPLLPKIERSRPIHAPCSILLVSFARSLFTVSHVVLLVISTREEPFLLQCSKASIQLLASSLKWISSELMQNYRANKDSAEKSTSPAVSNTFSSAPSIS